MVTLRSDAARNREAIVEAARAVFGERGLEVALDEIATRAGIGNATLYRRFPSRADLIGAVFAEQMAFHVAAVESALSDRDPWNGLRSYVEAVTRMQVRDRGLADLITVDLSAAPQIEELRRRAYSGLVELIGRARDAGVLRSDYTAEDVMVLLMANAGLVERSDRAAASASARLVHVVLDGMRAGAATEGPRPPPPRRMRLAMRAHGSRLRLCGQAGSREHGR